MAYDPPGIDGRMRLSLFQPLDHARFETWIGFVPLARLPGAVTQLRELTGKT